MTRVLLISPPWRTPHCSDLAPALLRPLLRQHGIEADNLYGSLLFPHTRSDEAMMEEHAGFLFVPWLCPEVGVPSIVETITRRHHEMNSLNGLLQPERDVPGWRRQVKEVQLRIEPDVRRAGVCLDRCVAWAQRGPYDVIGFSLTFETQIPAAVVIARRLKAGNPALRVMFGGAACLGEQADGLIRSFPEIDAVCHSEGEHVIAPLVRALRGEAPLSEVPGITWREPDGTLGRTASPPLLEDLDQLPLPEYEDFFEQLAESDWRREQPRLLFETSRGCWWGQKSWCSFCGLNAAGMAYRAKSDERAYTEIETLYRCYPGADFLQATDNILATQYFKTVLPRLAAMPREPGRTLRIFYEIKANLKSEQVAQLAEAGILHVQPGIETFHDEVLKLMRKGSTALGQVQFLKWAYQYGVSTMYNVLVHNPGEKAEWYHEMVDLIPFIQHLSPPKAVYSILLERFSPYHQDPAAYGIERMRPKAYYDELFPLPGVDIDNLAYHFDFDHPMYQDPELAAVLRVLAARVMAWCSGWQPDRAFCVPHEGGLVVIDRRSGAEQTATLSGVAAEVYKSLDKARPLHAVLDEFPDVAPSFIEGLIDGWVHRRWAYRDPRDRCLAVLPVISRR